MSTAKQDTPNKYRPSREVMDRRNEYLRTRNAFASLRSLIFEIILLSEWAHQPMEVQEAQATIKALLLHYSGNLNPEYQQQWISMVWRLRNLIRENAPYIPAWELDDLNTELNCMIDQIDVIIKELESNRKNGRPKKSS